MEADPGYAASQGEAAEAEEGTRAKPERHASPSAQRGSEWRERVDGAHKEHARTQESMWANGRSPSRPKERGKPVDSEPDEEMEGSDGEAQQDGASVQEPEGVFVDLDAMKSEAPEVTHTVL